MLMRILAQVRCKQIDFTRKMSFTRNLNDYLSRQTLLKEEKEIKEEKKVATKGGQIEDYNLLEEIGHGSFGHVYRATTTAASSSEGRREYAIKFISKLKAPNIAKILSEVSIHVRLEHEHVLKLANVLEDAKNVYLVMDMCHGGTLAQLINSEVNSRRKEKTLVNKYPLKPVLPYELITIIFGQLCDGLRYLHRHSIVHRDLNLNNLLLVKSFNLTRKKKSYHRHSIEVKIADFGLAIDLKTIDSMANGGSPVTAPPVGSTICGTPGFISPEIWTQMRTVSYKSDIFSLGSILFACIAGYTPKGDIDLSNFLPMTANLITSLLDPNPDDRPELDDIERHIFMSGHLVDTHRLYPLEKNTPTLSMSIDDRGDVEVVFLPSHFTIVVTDAGATILVTTAEAQLKRYNFYELPEVYWKRYAVLTKFVRLVAAKTPKVTVHCGQWFGDYFGGSSEKISRCVLVENGDFEITFHSAKGETFKLVQGDPSMSSNLSMQKYRTWLEDLKQQLKKLEEKVTSVDDEMGIDLFPISFGHNARVMEMRSAGTSKQVKDEVAGEDINKNESSICSFVSVRNQILRSINICGLGSATHFSDGAIKVAFDDGSDLCLDPESHILYAEGGELRRFTKEDMLPESVLNKVARLPQVIQYLRKLHTNAAAGEEAEQEN